MAKYGKIYLFPSTMGEATPPSDVLPARNIELLRRVRYFVVEELRTARRFLKACDRSIVIDELHFEVLNEHTPPEAVDSLLAPALDGHDIGVISEAGCPAVADPGADLVAVAQRKGLEVIPLVGPSSILLALMASGFNGQTFAFSGYLPYDEKARAAKFKEMERRIVHERQTQIFIETPYRNTRLIAELTRHFGSGMLLCVATDITGPRQSIITRPLSWWKTHAPEIDKIPSIFLLFN